MFRQNRWLVLAIVSSALFLIIIDMTVLYTALPRLTHDLGATATEKLWIVNAYPLVVAGLLPGAGLLSDRLGHKRLFLAGLPLFGLASLCAAFAPSAATADRRPRRVGGGRGADDAGDPVDRPPCLPGRTRTRPGHRHLGLRRLCRRGAGAGGRRRAAGVLLVGLGVPHQRPGGGRRFVAGAAGHPGLRRPVAAPMGRPRLAAGDVRPGRGGVCDQGTQHTRPGLRAGRPGRARRHALPVPVRPPPAPRPRTDDRLRAVPQPALRPRRRGGPGGDHGAGRHGTGVQPAPATGAGPDAAEGRPVRPADPAGLAGGRAAGRLAGAALGREPGDVRLPAARQRRIARPGPVLPVRHRSATGQPGAARRRLRRRDDRRLHRGDAQRGRTEFRNGGRHRRRVLRTGRGDRRDPARQPDEFRLRDVAEAASAELPARVRDSLDDALLVAEGLAPEVASRLVELARQAFDQAFVAVLLAAAALLFLSAMAVLRQPRPATEPAPPAPHTR
ncbi:major facilitator superfamily transporter [Pseudomonas aeruginosa]|nr:major facilitator superfamily transporter [Pseudomonas aeruginosa]